MLCAPEGNCIYHKSITVFGTCINLRYVQILISNSKVVELWILKQTMMSYEKKVRI